MLSEATRACALCRRMNCIDLGRILHPVPPLVAGVPIDLGDVSYHLIKCNECGFQFKDPVVPESKLADCYTASADDNWGPVSNSEKRDFQLIRDLLERYAPGNAILDIGCNNGAFLKLLGDKWNCFGIEPGRKAAALATQQGINVIGENIFALGTSKRFDAITAIDVIEHIADPMPFLKTVQSLLVPKGVFLVQTGDSDALPWRVLKNLHWYCSLPEHISFYCRRTLNFMAQQSCMEGIDYRRIRHRKVTARLWLVETGKNLAFLLANHTHGLGLPYVRRMAMNRRAPAWLSARDHMVYVFRNR